MQIDGRVVLVTGASGGLGQAIARDLASRGATVVLTARSTDAIEALADELGGEAITADLTDRADVERLAARAETVDILVANAGIGGDAVLADLDVAGVDASIETNLRAPIVLATAFVQAHLAAGTPGHAVLIGSLSGLAPSPGTAMYNATKFGLRGFALSARQDLHGTGVGLSIVEPGFIREAGMFAAGGIDLPPGVRTCAPADVARGVLTAITKDKGEVFVAPTELRLASTLSTVAPGLTARVMRAVDARGRVDRG